MAEASIPDTPQILTRVGADVVMGLGYWPATHFSIIQPAPKPVWTQEQRIAWIEAAGGKCPKCGIDLTLENTHFDHIFPRSKGGQNWGVNLRALCCTCNKIKSDDIEFVTVEALRGTMLGDLAAGASTIAIDAVSRIKWSEIAAILARSKNASAAIVVFAISHKAAILIVGGVVLVVAGYFAVKWLLEHADGERRYVRLARSTRESLSHLAHQAGRLARHLEGATEQARRVQSGMGGLARHASGVAGQVPARMGDVAVSARQASSTHAPTVAGHASQLARGAGRVSGQVARTAGGIAGQAGRVSARRVGTAAEQVPARVVRVAGMVGGVVRGKGPAHEVAQGALGRVSSAMPRLGLMSTAEARNS